MFSRLVSLGFTRQGDEYFQCELGIIITVVDNEAGTLLLHANGRTILMDTPTTIEELEQTMVYGGLGEY